MVLKTLLIILFFCSTANANIYQGLLGHWKFDNSTGTSDSSGNGNTLTLTGTAFVTNCPRNNCRSFNGTSDYTSVTWPDSGYTGTTPITISAWAKSAVSSYGGGYVLVADMGTFVSSGFDIDVDASTVKWGWNTPGQVTTLLSPNAIVANQWVHLVGTNDASNSVFYVNGAQAATGASGGSYTSVTGNFTIGTQSKDPTSRFFNGQIEDVRIYNRALTAAEVLDLYNQEVTLRGGSLNQ